MSDGHAPVWVYGARVRLLVRSSPALAVRIGVDGKRRLVTRIGPLREIGLRLCRPGWHLVTFDAHLPKVDGRPAGARVVAYARS